MKLNATVPSATAPITTPESEMICEGNFGLENVIEKVRYGVNVECLKSAALRPESARKL